MALSSLWRRGFLLQYDPQESNNRIRMKPWILALLIAAATSVAAQPPALNWMRIYGGPGNDGGADIVETADAGYLIVGVYSQGGVLGLDAYIVRLNAQGDTIWTRTYGGESDQSFSGIIETDLGQYILVGSADPTGSNTSDIRVTAVNSEGQENWFQSFGTSGNDVGSDIVQASNGDILVVGSYAMSGSSGIDGFAARLNTEGDTLWTRTYDIANTRDEFYAIDTADNGDYIIVGSGGTFVQSFSDILVTRIDSLGDTVWTRVLPREGRQVAYSVVWTENYEILLTGISDEPNDGFGASIIIVKIDSGGNTIWTRLYGTYDTDDGAYSIVRTTGGYLIGGWLGIVGQISTQALLMKISENGDTLWTSLLGMGNMYRTESIYKTLSGGFAVVGSVVTTSDFLADIFVAIYESEASGEYTLPQFCEFQMDQNYPNPFNSATRIPCASNREQVVSLSIYDVLGRQVKINEGIILQRGPNNILFDASMLSTGMYFYQIKSTTHNAMLKMICIR